MSFRRYFYRILRVILFMTLLLGLFGVSAAAIVVWYFLPQLPSVDNLKEVQFQVPLRIYNTEGKFMAEYGDQRRIPVEAEDFPPMLINAVVAAEDDQFFEHPGVDIKSLFRALFHLIKTGEIRQGGSTITMQMTRNYFLSPERTFIRKFKEILLALRIEQELTKYEILELYLNKIFFGHRSYGIEAAAQTYYGKTLKELNLSQIAMLAGIPKAPSANNPISNSVRSMERRNYILKRMADLGYIDQEAYNQAKAQPNVARVHKLEIELDAPYVAEMVRAHMFEEYGEDAYTRGFQVYTTLDSKLQKTAQASLRRALLTYDKRHGYRGPLDNIDLPKESQAAIKKAHQALKEYKVYGELIPSVVLTVHRRSVTAYNHRVGQFNIKWRDMKWARHYISDNRRGRYPSTAWQILKRGNIIMAHDISNKIKDLTHVLRQGETVPKNLRWALAEVPQVEGAIVALDTQTGKILALAGGFDFYHSKFNRVTQALRQPGSNFKPFIYSAALENNFTPASIINDAPVTFKAGNKIWQPDNYSHRFHGPTSLRNALAYSRNLVSIRVLNNIGIDKAIDHVVNFGFKRERIPKNLTIALGTGDVTPLELVRGFTVFANGGYLITPHFIERIENVENEVIYEAKPKKVCKKCAPYYVDPKKLVSLEKQVDYLKQEATEAADSEEENVNEEDKPHAPLAVSPRNAWIMTSMLKDVIQRGTARDALKLKRGDIAGKTGTTNEHRDAWFSGFHPNIAVTTWVGFDQPRSLGRRETGGKAALPMWMDFMRVALRDLPVKEKLPMPKGIRSVRIDPDSGLRASRNYPNAKWEYFYKETTPSRYAAYRPKKEKPSSSRRKNDSGGVVPDAATIW